MDILRRRGQKLSFNNAERLPVLGNPENPVGLRYRLWQNLLAVYTKANVTLRKDKIITISGLATKVGIEDEFVAGV